MGTWTLRLKKALQISTSHPRQEVEGHVKRAEATKSLPKRHDQAEQLSFVGAFRKKREQLISASIEQGSDVVLLRVLNNRVP